MDTIKQPESFYHFIRKFSSEDSCRKHLEKIRWGETVKCIRCACNKVYRLKDRYKCSNRECQRIFTLTSGTIFENSKLPLSKWFIAIYLCLSHKKGISSLQLARDLEVTQKTAWFMLHRIREMAREKQPIMLTDIVEVDETYIGGKYKNKRWNRKKKKVKPGRNNIDKIPVFGMLQRSGKVISMRVDNVKGQTLKPLIYHYVKKGSTIMSDEWSAYRGLNKHYGHYIVDHSKKQYVDGDVYTNTIEGFWSHLKRTILGTYHSISRKHTDRYCQESVFRYNTRNDSSLERFNLALTQTDCRLKYRQLVS